MPSSSSSTPQWLVDDVLCFPTRPETDKVRCISSVVPIGKGRAFPRRFNLCQEYGVGAIDVVEWFLWTVDEVQR